jgi:hypothetical protein
LDGDAEEALFLALSSASGSDGLGCREWDGLAFFRHVDWAAVGGRDRGYREEGGVGTGATL